MTRVTLVSYDDDPPLGGQGGQVRGMRAALMARGHTVTTIAGHGSQALRYPRLTGRAPLDFSVHLNRHPGLIRATQADVVHVSGGPGGVLLLRDVGAPVVYTANHTYAMAHRRGSLGRVMSLAEARAYRRAAMVLAISPSTAAAVRALGVPAMRVAVLPPGVDAPGQGTEPGPGRRLLYAGRWEREKGVLDAITVMREVIARRPGTTARVVGGGSLGAAVRRAAAAERGIEVAGHVDDATLSAEYSRATLVVMPSRYEGLGLVALEAQAHGAVVVGYDVDGLRDAVPEPGLLVSSGDVAALVAVCVELIDSPQRRGELAARASQRVRSEHSWEGMAARLEQVYTDVAGL
jgi:glycogen synthase